MDSLYSETDHSCECRFGHMAIPGDGVGQRPAFVLGDPGCGVLGVSLFCGDLVVLNCQRPVCRPRSPSSMGPQLQKKKKKITQQTPLLNLTPLLSHGGIISRTPKKL